MIEATQKKLREARFFLVHLENENRRAARNEPEVFDYFFSAFVSAACSVTMALHKEEKAKCKEWFPAWKASRTEEDRKLIELMESQRNEEIHEGGGDRSIEWEYDPITHLPYEGLGRRVSWAGPPGVPPPRVGRPIRYLTNKGDKPEALAACRKYCTLLAELVESFIKTYT